MGPGRVVCCVVTTILLLSSVILIEANNCSSTECEVRLRTDAGWVCGRIRRAEDTDHQYASFRGVPYAKPPLGELRFQELQLPDPWEGVRDATEDGPACPQKDFIYNRLVQQRKGMSEDCIWLNLHVPLDKFPNNNSTEYRRGLPILVFVHGGAFQVGSGLTDLHGPEYLMTQDIIVITFNIRIGIFGYLSLCDEKIPGNQGLRDVITLLRWVQRNARAFGGNPGDVTLMGHSTGSIIAHLISLSPHSQGLIHKVVLMSGTALANTISYDKKHAQYVAKKFLSTLGIEGTNSSYIYHRLTTEPLLNIMDAYNQVQITSDLDFMLSFGPVVETKYPNIMRMIDDYPKRLMERGRGSQYPMMIGFTTAEYYYFKWEVMAADPMSRIKTRPRMILPASIYYGYPLDRQLELCNTIKQKYSLDNGTLNQFLDYLSDLVFMYPALKTAELTMRNGPPVFLYQFSYEATRSVIKEALWSRYRGVAHVEDLTYVFRTNSLLLEQDTAYPPINYDNAMRIWMPMLISRFVICSEPTCRIQNLWTPLSEGNLTYQNIRMAFQHEMQNLTQKQMDAKMFFDDLLPASPPNED